MEKILNNKLGETDPEYLDCFCTAIAEFSLMELNTFPCPLKLKDFDQETFKNLHKYIYKDVFEWAGTYRKEFTDISFDKSFNLIKSLNEEVPYKKKLHTLTDFLAKSISSNPFTYGTSYTTIAFIKLVSHKIRLNFNTHKISCNSHNLIEAINQYTINQTPLLSIMNKAMDQHTYSHEL